MDHDARIIEEYEDWDCTWEYRTAREVQVSVTAERDRQNRAVLPAVVYGRRFTGQLSLLSPHPYTVRYVWSLSFIIHMVI